MLCFATCFVMPPAHAISTGMCHTHVIGSEQQADKSPAVTCDQQSHFGCIVTLWPHSATDYATDSLSECALPAHTEAWVHCWRWAKPTVANLGFFFCIVGNKPSLQPENWFLSLLYNYSCYYIITITTIVLLLLVLLLLLLLSLFIIILSLLLLLLLPLLLLVSFITCATWRRAVLSQQRSSQVLPLLLHHAFLCHQHQMQSWARPEDAQRAAHLEIMDCILLVGSPPKGNQDSVLSPGYKALGAGQGVPHQLKMFQVVQLHCRLFWHFHSLQWNNSTIFVPVCVIPSYLCLLKSVPVALYYILCSKTVT